MITSYLRLMRLDKPVGILLLLWPTLSALWLANHGTPTAKLLLIFVLGTVLTRSAGCVVNDLADRHFDGLVVRTQRRPLACQAVSVKGAIILAGILWLASLGLVLLCNALTFWVVSFVAMVAIVYPFTKRFFVFPQAVLGIAFAFGVLMAFAAVGHTIPSKAWVLFATFLIWPLIYDTLYAMVDRVDDLKIGIRSSAILFGHHDRWCIGMLQMLFIGMLSIVGKLFELNAWYFVALCLCGCLLAYQQWLIKTRDRECCFKAFLNNQWVGLVIFLGILFQ